MPLLGAACEASERERLFAWCRRFVVEHSGAVRRGGGVEQLREIGVAKGLLGDALDCVARLEAPRGRGADLTGP